MDLHLQHPAAHSPLRVRNGRGEIGRQSWVKFKAEALMSPPSTTSLPPQAQHITSLLDIITSGEESEARLFMSEWGCVSIYVEGDACVSGSHKCMGNI